MKLFSFVYIKVVVSCCKNTLLCIKQEFEIKKIIDFDFDQESIINGLEILDNDLINDNVMHFKFRGSPPSSNECNLEFEFTSFKLHLIGEFNDDKIYDEWEKYDNKEPSLLDEW